MSDTSIKPIGSVQPSDGSTLSKALASAQTEANTQTRAVAAHQEKPQIDARAQTASTGIHPDVSIHFRVDNDTNEVTIFLVDRQSKLVLRSIPSSELSKLQIGELLKLTG